MPLGRVVGIAGAVLIAVAAVLPWVTVSGRLPLDLGLLGADVTAGGRTVGGEDTAAFPYLLGLAAGTSVLTVLGRARRLLLLLGVLVTVAGGALVYYLTHVVDIETSDRSVVERTAAELALDSSVELGPYALILAGVLVIAGAAARGRR
jgi:hypothetical protein